MGWVLGSVDGTLALAGRLSCCWWWVVKHMHMLSCMTSDGPCKSCCRWSKLVAGSSIRSVGLCKKKTAFLRPVVIKYAVT